MTQPILAAQQALLAVASYGVTHPPTRVPWQDYVVIAGVRTPGYAEVRGAGSPRKWDIRDGYGQTGASLVYTGTSLTKFEVDVFAWQPEHFDAWEVFARAVLPAPTPAIASRAAFGKASLSLSIQHPLLNDPPLSITQAVVEDVSQWEQGEEGGLWARTIKMIQYRAPAPIIVPSKQGPDGSPIAVRPPANPEEAIIAENSRLIEELNKP